MSLSKKKIRQEWRLSVFERDFFQCKKCNPKARKKPMVIVYAEIDAHHIVDRNEIPDGGYVLSNGITLCHPCHLKAEQYHISGGANWNAGYHPDDLSKLVCQRW
jgi:5-methylcytosine-specific restriction endonuclease McrA